ncbi:methylenetetrahydrofolate reductase C-terminal domain-containing protein [Rhodococcus sp. NPDC004095]
MLPILETCPKSMRIGPCGGVFADGGCEIRPSRACSFLDLGKAEARSADESAFVPAAGSRPAHPAGSSLKATLDSGRFTIIAEVNGADSSDATEFVDSSRVVAEVADIVSITDHSGANVHMGNIAATAHLRNAGLDVMPTFGCRDRNRIALQGDLLGAASLGVRNALIVTGNHVDVGDSPDARAVFDLDSPRLLAIADRLRTEGVLDNGRAVEVAPDLYLGAVVHPFAPPYDDRPRQAIRKVRSGADFIISQHIFDVDRWRSFLAEVNRLRVGERPFHLLGGIAIMPSETIARQVNAGLRGFSIPETLLTRLRQAKDPQDEGIEIAAELLTELIESEGVSGCLLAPVTGRQNALAASVEQSELIAEVRRRAGIPVGREALV